MSNEWTSLLEAGGVVAKTLWPLDLLFSRNCEKSVVTGAESMENKMKLERSDHSWPCNPGLWIWPYPKSQWEPGAMEGFSQGSADVVLGSALWWLCEEWHLSFPGQLQPVGAATGTCPGFGSKCCLQCL